MSSHTYRVIRSAVLDKLQVSATYKGHRREFCPHVLGLKDGKEHVLAFQFGGTSSSGLPPGGEWRCMDVAELTNLTSQKGSWHTSHSHSKPQRCVDQIDVEVPY